MAKHSRNALASRVRRARPDSNFLEHQLNIRHCDVDTIRPDPLNPRKHSHKQVQQIADSIRSFGFNVREVPTVSLGHLSPQQLRAFMIADNKLTENSTWDEVLLGQQLKALSEVELDFNLEATGFEMAEIDLLIEGLAPSTDSAPDPADAIPERPGFRVSKSGDWWKLGEHRLLCGDALDPVSYARLMGDRLASVIFTDPPYNVPIEGHASGLGKKQHGDFLMASGEMSDAEFTDFLGRVCNRLSRSSRDGAIHFICMDWRHVGELLEAGREVYDELKNICVRVKDNAGMGSFYRSQHEFVFVFKSGSGTHRNNVQLGRYGRYRTNVWHYPGVNSFSRSTDEGNLLELHPTVKPVALVADAVMDCSNRNDIVLDPFLGSGTTIIAAERTGRKCYGIELDPSYVDTAIRRWQAFTGLSAMHGKSGCIFAQMEEEAANGK